MLLTVRDISSILEIQRFVCLSEVNLGDSLPLLLLDNVLDLVVNGVGRPIVQIAASRPVPRRCLLGHLTLFVRMLSDSISTYSALDHSCCITDARHSDSVSLILEAVPIDDLPDSLSHWWRPLLS